MKYIYKQKEYKLLYDDIEVKDTTSRLWKSEQIESGLLFVREYNEFINLFEEVKG